MKNRLVTLSLITILTSITLFADTQDANKSTKVEKKDVPKSLTEAEKKEMMATTVFELPSAGALANHLQTNLGVITWSKFMNFTLQDISKISMERRALRLGSKGADAYFLAIAQDDGNLNAVSKNIENTLNRIIINKKPLRNRIGKEKLKTLEDTIKAKRWAKVLDQITTLKDNIAEEFSKGNKEDLQILNDIGGWLEGYRLAVKGFNENFKASKTDVLVQDELIGYLLKEIKSVKDFKEKEVIVKILTDINSVLSKASKERTLSKAQVAELSKILANVTSIL